MIHKAQPHVGAPRAVARRGDPVEISSPSLHLETPTESVQGGVEGDAAILRVVVPYCTCVEITHREDLCAGEVLRECSRRAHCIADTAIPFDFTDLYVVGAQMACILHPQDVVAAHPLIAARMRQGRPVLLVCRSESASASEQRRQAIPTIELFRDERDKLDHVFVEECIAQVVWRDRTTRTTHDTQECIDAMRAFSMLYEQQRNGRSTSPIVTVGASDDFPETPRATDVDALSSPLIADPRLELHFQRPSVTPLSGLGSQAFRVKVISIEGE